jgi:Fic family protein
MEERDEKLIARLIQSNDTLKEYVEQHRDYERQLEEFNKRIHLSTDESIERKRIQKLKLANRDRIERILVEHRVAQGE